MIKCNIDSLKQCKILNTVFYIILLLFFTFMWLKQVQPYIEDDGAFFLRYAVNMTHGAFWKYNLEDVSPIWGASAPLWPIVIAFFIKLGLAPDIAIRVASYVCAVLFVLITVVVLNKKCGKYAVILFVLFVSLDGRLQHYFTSGLESPLAAVMLSLLLATTLDVIPSKTIFALVTGFLAVQKIDLIPLVVIVTILHIYYKGFDKKTLAIIVFIPLFWYIFAWIYFGFPLPNSFLTKALHQGELPVITAVSWFTGFLTSQTWRIGIYLFLPCLLLCFLKYRFFTLTFVALIVIHSIAYTIKRPFEPYFWYVIPSIIAYFFILTIGLAIIINKLKLWPLQLIITIIIATLYCHDRWSYYVDGAKSMVEIGNLADADRALAGKWVSKYTANNATVYTGWGLPGYYANRYIYDFSFLNRKFETNDLITTYKPDVLIHQGYISGDKKTAKCDNPGLFAAHKEYHIIKTFTSSFKATGQNYCFFVAVKNKNILILKQND